MAKLSKVQTLMAKEKVESSTFTFNNPINTFFRTGFGMFKLSSVEFSKFGKHYEIRGAFTKSELNEISFKDLTIEEHDSIISRIDNEMSKKVKITDEMVITPNEPATRKREKDSLNNYIQISY